MVLLLAASHHMYEFGTTREQLAAVAVAAREWALLNPVAWEKKPLTINGVLSARMVGYLLTVCDCCLVNDGGAIVTTLAGDDEGWQGADHASLSGNSTSVSAPRRARRKASKFPENTIF